MGCASYRTVYNYHLTLSPDTVVVFICRISERWKKKVPKGVIFKVSVSVKYLEWWRESKSAVAITLTFLTTISDHSSITRTSCCFSPSLCMVTVSLRFFQDISIDPCGLMLDSSISSSGNDNFSWHLVKKLSRWVRFPMCLRLLGYMNFLSYLDSPHTIHVCAQEIKIKKSRKNATTNNSIIYNIIPLLYFIWTRMERISRKVKYQQIYSLVLWFRKK